MTASRCLQQLAELEDVVLVSQFTNLTKISKVFKYYSPKANPTFLAKCFERTPWCEQIFPCIVVLRAAVGSRFTCFLTAWRYFTAGTLIWASEKTAAMNLYRRTTEGVLKCHIYELFCNFSLSPVNSTWLIKSSNLVPCTRKMQTLAREYMADKNARVAWGRAWESV